MGDGTGEDPISGDGGRDSINISGDIAGEVHIETGSGDDFVSISGFPGPQIAGAVRIDTGSGDDTVSIDTFLPESQEEFTVFGGSVVIDLRSGDDRLNVRQVVFDSDFLANGQQGDDTASVIGNPFNGLADFNSFTRCVNCP